MCWHCRECDRFQDGTYKRVPWAREPWAEDSHRYVHVSRHDPKLVAYTASEEHGEQDRQTRTTPGRYLTKFHGDVLSQKDIQHWCGRFKGENGEDTHQLKFAHTPDEIEDVYERGPDSCMSGPADRDDFKTEGIHPARVYGAGDLAVAYIEAEGRITARCVCWPERSIYGRCYGDHNLLEAKLVAEGFRTGSFNGARLLRIECEDGLVCPYLDIADCVDDNGEYLVVGEGDITVSNTNGLAQLGPLCPNCQRRSTDEGWRYVQDAGEHWCCSCIEGAFYCEYCGDHYSSEAEAERTVDHFTRICQRCAVRYYTYCEVCEAYHGRYDALCEEEEESGTSTVVDERQPAFL